MASPSLDYNVLAVPMASQTPDPDRAIRIAQAFEYPNRAWYCIAAFIGFVSVCHFVALLYRIQRRPLPPNAQSRGPIVFRRLPAAVMNAFRALAFRWTIPIGRSYTLNVAEVFLTAAYIVILFVWSLVNSTNTKGLKFDPKYWANTAGNIASSQLPLMTALGMKNNIISWLTGVSFDKLNYLHRMSARVLCILMWLHGAGRMKLGLAGRVAWVNPWVQCGMLATTSLTLLSIVSIRPLRERNYEVFLAVHFLLSFICVLAAYFHAQGLELGYYIWPAFLIWGLDRLLRAVRIVAFNSGYFRKNFADQNAHIDVLSPHFVRITLHRPGYLHWLPGQSAYLTMPSVSAFPFEAHPFTISTIDSPSETTDSPSETPVNEKAEHPLDEASSGSRIVTSSLKKLTFLVRVRSGFTKNLLNAAEKDAPTKVILDGPYSSPPLLKGFETVVLIAGGSGVAFTLPLLLDSIHRAKRGSSACRKIVFLWAIRDASHMGWISDALLPALQHAPSTTIVDVRVFVTSVKEDASSWDDDSVEGNVEKRTERAGKSDTNALDHPAVRIQQGRPDLKHLLEAEINDSHGAISVNVCGTHALADATRSALRAPRFLDVLKGGPTVTLHVEAFGNV
ncbi:Ferric/cupric reductase transmembrane component 1 [Hypsizygus marmoreus]|uniref:Ferric/cupric reductase transmembrane component 1 n=1 Tax=Hypsizygus marmoreus TaxID=39966 RepID=A0A369K662_HYPMA|nr:Ferric/cupric reductase transmembrane component 1 [Hypsizygus marmoreus]